MSKVLYDTRDFHEADLRLEKITEADLPLFRQLDIRDWSGKGISDESLLRFGTWVVNADRSIVFKALGGGSSEIPEMYQLCWRGTKVLLECGGGGDRCMSFTRRLGGKSDCVIHVSQIKIPQALASEREAILKLLIEALGVTYRNGRNMGKISVELGPWAPQTLR